MKSSSALPPLLVALVGLLLPVNGLPAAADGPPTIPPPPFAFHRPRQFDNSRPPSPFNSAPNPFNSPPTPFNSPPNPFTPPSNPPSSPQASSGSLDSRAGDGAVNSPLNSALAQAASLPPLNLAYGALGDVYTRIQELLVPAVGGPGAVTANDIQQKTACGDVALVFARGTTEPGNMGVFVGPEFVQALKVAMPGARIMVQGVDYAATIQQYLAGGGEDGVRTMTRLVTTVADQCPNTPIIVSGYSQGCQVAHKSFGALPPASKARVRAIVLFGDPFSKQRLPGGVGEDRRLVVCHPDDNICANGDIILATHLTYGLDAPAAADWVVKKIGPVGRSKVEGGEGAVQGEGAQGAVQQAVVSGPLEGSAGGGWGRARASTGAVAMAAFVACLFL